MSLTQDWSKLIDYIKLLEELLSKSLRLKFAFISNYFCIPQGNRWTHGHILGYHHKYRKFLPSACMTRDISFRCILHFYIHEVYGHSCGYHRKLRKVQASEHMVHHISFHCNYLTLHLNLISIKMKLSFIIFWIKNP